MPPDKRHADAHTIALTSVVLAALLCMLIAACGTGGSGGGSAIPPPPNRSPAPRMFLYNIPTGNSFPAGITPGSDGNVWFVEGVNTINQIARVDVSSDDITEFKITGCAIAPEYLTTGSDGDLWAGAICNPGPSGYAEMVTMSTSGVTQNLYRFPAGYDAAFYDTLGPDGNVWFTAQASGMVGKITPSGQVTEYSLSTPQYPTHRPNGITVGPDGNLWVVEGYSPVIDVVGTNGAIINQFSNPDMGSGIVTGPDGNLWFTTMTDRFGTITTGGKITIHPLPNQCNPGLIEPLNITKGPDGAVWIAETFADSITRIDTAMNISSFCLPPTPDGPFDVSVGPDGNIWFTVPGLNQIGKIVIGTKNVTPRRPFEPNLLGLRDRRGQIK